MGKINLVELLRNCPKGMELDCTICEDVYFDYVSEFNIIYCYIQYETYRTSITFNQYGAINSDIKSKCVIFPKGKTTWEGFVPSYQFKDGDVLFVDCSDGEDKSYQYIFILNKPEFYGKWHSYCHLDGVGDLHSIATYLAYDEDRPRLATEEEKEKLFKVIKDNGYKWNEETKTLEKLPKFKDGDIVVSSLGHIHILKNRSTSYIFVDFAHNANGSLCKSLTTGVNVNRFATEEEKAKLFKVIKDNGYRWNEETKTLEKLVEHRFKVGDRIRHKCHEFRGERIVNICCDTGYFTTINDWIDIAHQDDWELVPAEPKFKDGDIAASNDSLFVGIVKYVDENCIYTYCAINKVGNLTKNFPYFFHRLATEEEKAKLFQAIKDNGYRWNEETKTLEELPKFKVGDKIFNVLRKSMGALGTFEGTISEITNDKYIFTDGSYMLISCQDNYELVPVEPQFKVGDRIRHKNDKTVITITGIKDNYYLIQFYNLNKNDYQNEKVLFKDQDKYELVQEFKDGDVIVCENHWGSFISIFKENVTERNGFIGHCVFDVDDNEFTVKNSASYFNKVRFATKSEKEHLFRAIKNNGYKWNPDNKTLEKSTPNPDKFDITSLKTFDQVLVRDFDNTPWEIEFFSRLLDGKHFKCSGLSYMQCIPYKGNEHLNGKKDDCDKYFKTWE